MAKKSQTNARRNNTQAGRRVVNFYNNGTINIDARQNRSRTNKTENNGCTINYPCHPSTNLIGDYLTSPDQLKPYPSTEFVNHSAPIKNKNRKSSSISLRIAGRIAIACIVGGIIMVAHKYSH